MSPVHWIALLLLCAGCAEKKPERPATIAAIDSAFFAVLESELTPAILVHSAAKYLGLFGETNAPSHIGFATRSGPRTFALGQKLVAAELEESWLLVWWTNKPPWVVYLHHKPLALSLDSTGLHLSFARDAGDVMLLPLHGISTNVDTRKWMEFLPREPLLRIRYWASALREVPIACETSFRETNQSVIVRQKFHYHSIRDDWNTKPLRFAPMSPALAQAADENLKRKLRELEMPTPFGDYTGIENVAEWEAVFPLLAVLTTNCAWATFGADCLKPTNTVLIHALHVNGWPKINGVIKPLRDLPPPPPTIFPLSPNSRLITVGIPADL